MYPLLEGFAVAGFVLVLGAALFLSLTLAVLVEAGVRMFALKFLALASRSAVGLGQKLEPLAQPVGHGALKVEL